MSDGIRYAPLTAGRWSDLEAVMTTCGDARRCWCAFWRRPNAVFRAEYGEGNKRFFKAVVEAGRPAGVLAYRDGRPVGWCAIAPRADQERLARSRVLAPVDDAPVWSITCFVVARGHRRSGLMRALIAGAVEEARRQGAATVEAYPLDLTRKIVSGEAYVGLIRPFLDLGFREVARRSPTRPIVRLELAQAASARRPMSGQP